MYNPSPAPLYLQPLTCTPSPQPLTCTPSPITPHLQPFHNSHIYNPLPTPSQALTTTHPNSPFFAVWSFFLCDSLLYGILLIAAEIHYLGPTKRCNPLGKKDGRRKEKVLCDSWRTLASFPGSHAPEREH